MRGTTCADASFRPVWGEAGRGGHRRWSADGTRESILRAVRAGAGAEGACRGLRRWALPARASVIARGPGRAECICSAGPVD
ncbi:hypothetical protein DY245_32735 [Streptomyces inhibens]|uniref:Uncharacterized protein n=1 Tax=Streptomyces inhibens TaxID=2293571 RepID=A0A371PVC5_STRIH|nr:hypothetical protein DY245_32735 [Streptomyces inhibens]